MTAPEKEKTLLTMEAAKAMKLMPKTTDKSSLKPPEISSLFMMKITPQRAIATMEIHFPAGPVMVFTTRSKGLENSVMPPEAAAMSGRRRRQTADRLQSVRTVLKELQLGRRLATRMTISVEAVRRREVGACSPQNNSVFTTRAAKLYFSSFKMPSGQ